MTSREFRNAGGRNGKLFVLVIVHFCVDDLGDDDICL
jgi:hypothetical protein